MNKLAPEYVHQMELLCRAMPCLRAFRGTVPWNPKELARSWPAASGGERAAIQFVITVWDSQTRYSNSWKKVWGFTPFSLEDFSRLDDENRKAVVAWFAAPFWP